MAITKIQAGALPAGVVTVDAIADTSITHAKLHTTMDLSGKTVTLPTISALDVTDAITGDTSQFKITNGAGATLRMGITGSGSNENAHIKTNSSEDLEFHIGQASNSADPTVIIKSAASGGKVGIGTASPSYQIHSYKTGVNVDNVLKVENDQVNYGAVFIADANSNYSNYQSVTPTASWIFGQRGLGSGKFEISDSTGTLARRLVIDSSGNVGIGTSTPTAILDVRRGDASGKIAEFHTNTGYGVEIGSSQSEAYVQSGHLQALVLGTHNTERLRIDNTGNVLVGKTTNTISAAGAKLGTGGSNFTRSGAEVVYVNRTTNDGAIISLGKDGTTVGSINVENGNINIGSGDTGIRFDSANNTLIPVNMTTNGVQSGTTDLGSTNYKWKNLYLSHDVIAEGHVKSAGGADKIGGTETVFTNTSFALTTSAQTVVPRSAIMHLPTGTYLMRIQLSGGNWYSTTVTGLVQHYAGTTNSTSSGGPNTIHLTSAGHAQNAGSLSAKYQTFHGNANNHGVMIWSTNSVTTSVNIEWTRLI